MILWRIIIERRMPAYQNLTGIILAYLSIDTDNYTAMIIWKIMIKFIRPVVRRHIFMVDQLRIKNKTTVKKFTMKYQQMENEDGYLLVTEEIKRELQEMAAEDGQEYDGEWHEFCFFTGSRLGQL